METPTKNAISRSPRIRSTALTGSAVIAVFFIGLGAWAALAPLDSAAIAPGWVSVDSNRKTIQHLEGGIVQEILVREGDEVSKGELLVRLDETRPRATLDLLNGRRVSNEVLRARLVAERDGRKEVQIPDWLFDRLDDTKVVEAIDGQINIFKARREALSGQIAIQNQQIAQLEEEITGLRGEIKSQKTQLSLIVREITDIRGLVDKGLAPRPRLLSLERRGAEIEGALARNQAAIARAKQGIGEARLRITELRSAMLNEVVIELRDVDGKLFDLAEQIRAAEDVLTRTKIFSPLAGTVVGLQIHTAGGVIGPGERLMEIVPSGDRLVVEARISPTDIDVVHSGLAAEVRFPAFSIRTTAPVPGNVKWVSADRLTDERSGAPYYLSRIELTGDPATALDGASLYPGMPAEVMILTGSRTALHYIFKPMTVSLNRAFREQ